MNRARILGAAAMATAALAMGLPSVAEAVPVKPGDRTVTVVVRNQTNLRLKLVEADLAEGKWTTEPPKFVKGWTNGRYGSTSSESMGGTEATVTYSSRLGNLEFYYDVAWAAENSYDCDVPEELKCEYYDSGPDSNKKVVYTVTWADED